MGLNAPPPDERMLASVLFIDLVDSTAIGESLDVERVRAILADYFGLLTAAVQAWGGTVEKFIGDAAVALFGVPRVREDDAARAVSAALEILERFATMSADLEGGSGVRPEIRAAGNTGGVLAPAALDPDRPMVTGDAVNVAARLQSAAEIGTLLVGERTYHATRELFRFGERVALELKGKREPVAAYPVLGHIEGAVEAGPARNLQADIVGRDRELGALSGLLDEAVDSGAPQVALLLGGAGIGKSRLAREVVGLGQARHPELTVLRGRCPSIGPDALFWALAEIVRGACGLSLNASALDGQLKLGGLRTSLSAGGLAAADVEAVLFALATTAGIDLPDNPLDQSRPLAVATELARRWPQFLSALAATRPVAVVIEDLHWASDQLLDLLEAIASRSTGPLFMVATARPEFIEHRPAFVSNVTGTVMTHLQPLDRSQATLLVSGLLPGRRVPADLVRQIIETAEGNPLFVEEIVNRLVETGGLEGADERWPGHAAMPLPDTIYGLLAARVDALPDLQRRVLREASVVGRTFWEKPLRQALGEDDLEPALRGLEQRGLIVLRPTSSLIGQVEYAFKHALIRDVAYAGLTLARRAHAHAELAGWLTQLAPDRPDELAQLAAMHYEAALAEGTDLAWRAGDDVFVAIQQHARDAFLAAAATARQRHALDRAIELHRQALELSISPEQRAVSLEALGDDHDAAYDGDRALPAWDEAIAILRDLPGRGEDIARIAMKVARISAIRWGGFTVPVDPVVIDRYVDAGLGATRDAKTRAWLQSMRAAAGLRWVAFHRDDPTSLEDRVQAGEDALRHARRIGDLGLESTALRQVSGLLMAHGEVARGLELCRRQLEQARGIQDPRTRHLATIEAIQTLTWIGGEPERHLVELESLLVLARELRPHDICHSTAVLMSANYLAGRWDAIPAVLDEHLTTFKIDAAGTTCPFALGGFQFGATFLALRGDAERAREVAASMPEPEAPVGIIQGFEAMAASALADPVAARRIAEGVLSTGLRDFSEEPPVELLAELDALATLGDWAGLEAFLPEARRRADQLALAGPAIDRADGLRAAAAGDRDHAIDVLNRAAAGFKERSAFDTAWTRELLAAVDRDRAVEHLGAALEAYENLGARPGADRVAAALVAQDPALPKPPR